MQKLLVQIVSNEIVFFVEIIKNCHYRDFRVCEKNIVLHVSRY